MKGLSVFKLLKRVWKYVITFGRVKFDESADPAIQLEQAIVEAHDRHERLVDQAANVIALQRGTERDLDHALQERDKVQGNTRDALLLQKKAADVGDAAKAGQYGTTAQAFANRLIGLEKRVEVLQGQLLEAAKSTDSAKAMVKNDDLAFQHKLEEKTALLGELERAKVTEQYNAARRSMTAVMGEDVPSFDEIRDKINKRASKAEGMSELIGTSVDAGMLEVEAASMDANADERLKVMRIQLGLEAPEAPEALTAGSDDIVDATIVPDSPEGVQAPVTGRGGGTSGGV